jgi:hypothetical protein
MTQRSTHLSLPLVMEGQAQKHVTVNAALAALDAVVQLAVDGLADAPPADPTDDARWLVGPAPAGDWAGRAGAVAARQGTGAGGWWAFHAPARGWTAWDRAAGIARVWTGTAWAPAAPERLDRLGVATDADATNRLAVAAPGTLLSHAGGDHRVTVNKAAASDTASLLFQSGWSGRAEIGLAGGDALAVKTSADGAVWAEALSVAPTGQVALPLGQFGAALDVARGAVLRVPTPAEAGFCLIAPRGAALDAAGVVAFATGAAPALAPVWAGAAFGALPMGVPTGTTGPDGSVGLAAHSDGALHLENRHPTATAFSVTWLGCAPT